MMALTCDDTRSGDVDHSIREVERSVRGKHRRAKRVPSHKLHDTSDKLAHTTKEHQHAHQNIGSLDTACMYSEYGDQEYAGRKR